MGYFDWVTGGIVAYTTRSWHFFMVIFLINLAAFKRIKLIIFERKPSNL